MSQHILMICHGNICRSPMAERVARAHAERECLDVTITSAGVSAEEDGNPIDRRAASVLREAGYDASNHRAHQVTALEVREADLVVAAEEYHLDRLRRLVPDAENLHLFSEFDPEASTGDGLPDPWYGGMDGFHDTLAAVERAMPALMERVRQNS
ncbi:protein-tyrosine phosphatase [Luteococcus japonicus]|uniref:protein-tyrosine-phosphatase n=1 Tax=Luteococcus japonicus TaxID=33984 RepID=A0A3N1ZUL5_9ACTN|nr:low molecular weight protein-tyrosine-phosphatase [Luteococcus japonicus]ROR54555.1 protein-tyrosine phosphatase [Luteococcus japonicus]